MAEKFLSILVPVSREVGLLEGMLADLSGLALLLRGQLEIVVADHRGLPQTAAVIQGFRNDGLDIVHVPTERSVSVEQIALDGLQGCTGVYTAFLRTKDRLNVGPFINLIGALRKDAPDLLFVNPPVKLNSGQSLHSHYVNDPESLIGLSGEHLIREIGFTGLVYNLTGIIARTERLKQSAWQQYADTCPVYCLAAALIDAFHGQETRMMAGDAFELIVDRADFGADFEIASIMKAQGLPALFPWTLGILRLVDLLLQNGKVNSFFFSKVKERNPSGVYHQNVHCLIKILDNLQNNMAGVETVFPFGIEEEQLLERAFANSNATHGAMIRKLSSLIWRFRSLHGLLHGAGAARSNVAENVLQSTFKHLGPEEQLEVKKVLSTWAIDEISALRESIAA